MEDRIRAFLDDEDNKIVINKSDWWGVFQNASTMLKNRDFDKLLEILESSLDIDLTKDRENYLRFMLTMQFEIFIEENSPSVSMTNFVRMYIDFRVGFSESEIFKFILENKGEWDVDVYISPIIGDYCVRIKNG